jgi:hypothetical protein
VAAFTIKVTPPVADSSSVIKLLALRLPEQGTGLGFRHLTRLCAHGLDGAALANYLAGFINDQWVWMICRRPALRLRREPAFARTVSVGAPHVPPTLLLSPQFKTDATSTHFFILLCGRAKSAARPVIHPNPYQEHTPTVLYARHPTSVLVSYAGMIPKRALVEPTNRGFMLNEGKADVLPDEAVGASEGRHTTERKIADPNAC